MTATLATVELVRNDHETHDEEKNQEYLNTEVFPIVNEILYRANQELAARLPHGVEIQIGHPIK